MTFTINGIGTQIYGKHNRLTRNDHCEHCHDFGVLQSYDTTKYFVVLFVPLIPLSKLRIFDHCPSCNRWRQLSLKAWEAEKENALREAFERLKSNHNDPDAVKQAIATATQFQDESLLLKLKDLTANMPHDEEVQILYAVALGHFGQSHAAVEPLERAIAVNDSRDTREQLAITLVQIGEAERAEQTVDYVWNEDSPEHIPVQRVIAEGYFNTNDQSAALDRVNRMATMHPQLEDDRDFKSFRKKVQKHATSGKQVVSSFEPRQVESPSKGLNLAAYIGPAIVVFLIGLYFYSAFARAQNRKVHVVNGLEVPYTAFVNGQEIPLDSGQRKTITVPEGALTISARGESFEIAEQTADLSTPFLSRPFVNYTFVVNPDSTAVVEHAKIIYAEDHTNINHPEPTYHCGQNLHVFTSVDYPFEEPDDEITLDRDGLATRQSVQLVDSDFSYVYLSPQRQVDYCKRQLQYGSDSMTLVAILAAVGDPEEFVEFSEPFLAERPLRIDWHRVFQDHAEAHRPDFDLVQHYQSLSEKEPKNSGLMYLHARTLQDSEKKLAILKRACETCSEVSPYAYYGRAYELAVHARFDEAVEHARKAYESVEDPSTFAELYLNCLKATGNWRDAISLIHGSQPEASDRSESLYLRLTILHSLISCWVSMESEASFIQQQIDDFLDELRTDSNVQADSIRAVQSKLEATRDYALGNLDELYSQADDDEAELWQLISQRKITRASELATTEAFADDYISHLQVYTAAMDADASEIAESHLTAAIEILKSGDKDDRRLADTCESSNDEKLHVSMSRAQEARTVALALSRRIPSQRDVYESLATKLNFDRSFPYWFIRDSIEKENR
ncbi:MAG: hypothetical protein KDB27_21945 [Planctomycetales bacterium]|nr:hypothetical protein [Planctomycetales bacterium]